MKRVNKKEELSDYQILQLAKLGMVNPKVLTAKQRKECLEVLKLELQKHAAIAGTFKWVIKTIRHKWDETRPRSASNPVQGLALHTIAELIAEGVRRNRYECGLVDVFATIFCKRTTASFDEKAFEIEDKLKA